MIQIRLNPEILKCSAHCSRVAIGTVIHRGQTHDRVSRYEAQLSVSLVDQGWKLESRELLNEECLERRP